MTILTKPNMKKVERTFNDNLTRQISESVYIFRTEQKVKIEVCQITKYELSSEIVPAKL